MKLASSREKWINIFLWNTSGLSPDHCILYLWRQNSLIHDVSSCMTYVDNRLDTHLCTSHVTSGSWTWCGSCCNMVRVWTAAHQLDIHHSTRQPNRDTLLSLACCLNIRRSQMLLPMWVWFVTVLPVDCPVCQGLTWFVLRGWFCVACSPVYFPLKSRSLVLLWPVLASRLKHSLHRHCDFLTFNKLATTHHLFVSLHAGVYKLKENTCYI
jgi:hypothetical protein